ncbi:hypothetical protein [Aphanothece hegewaldii]|nr:hypothetical protein [Aphanothece hegewaldii]
MPDNDLTVMEDHPIYNQTCIANSGGIEMSQDYKHSRFVHD